MKTRFVFFALFLFFVSMSYFSQLNQGTSPINFEDGKFGELNNGIKYYIMYCDTQLIHIVAYVKAGSACESLEENGFSRIVFKAMERNGGKLYNSSKLEDLNNKKSIKLSFSLDDQYVKISVTALKDDIEECLNLIKDVLFNCNLTETSISDSKEYLKNILKNKSETIYNKTYKELFKLLYGENAIESKELPSPAIARIEEKKVLAFYKKFYIPSHCYIGIGSNLPIENVERLVTSIFEPITVKKGESCPFPDKLDNESIVLILQKVNLPKTWVGIGKKINLPSDGNQLINDLPILELIFASLYSNSPHSRLIKQFKVVRNLSEEIILYYYVSNNPKKGYFVVFVNPESKKTGFACYIIGKVFADLVSDPPKEEELQMAKMSLIGNLNYICSVPEELLKPNMEYIIKGFPPNYLKNYAQIVNSATIEDILKVCREYFSMKKYQYVLYGSGENFFKEVEVFGKTVMRNASID